MRLGPAVLSFAAALACSGTDSTGGLPPGEGRLIDVRYISALGGAEKLVVAAAVQKWESALSKNLGDFELNSTANHCFAGEPQLNEVHHNLLLLISVGEVDGAGGELAYTNVCARSDSDLLPTLSHIRLDKADIDSMVARGTFRGVVTHEMAHALGFNPGSYIAKGLAAGGLDDPYFTGERAREEFAKHGAWYTGVTVPLENHSNLGTKDPHWRFIVFGDELMVPAVSRDFKSPLSVITLGLFKDLGYDVDFSVADAYEVRPLFPGNLVLPYGHLQNDVRTNTPPLTLTPLVSR